MWVCTGEQLGAIQEGHRRCPRYSEDGARYSEVLAIARSTSGWLAIASFKLAIARVGSV